MMVILDYCNFFFICFSNSCLVEQSNVFPYKGTAVLDGLTILAIRDICATNCTIPSWDWAYFVVHMLRHTGVTTSSGRKFK